MITVTFNGYEEMMGFAKKLVGDAMQMAVPVQSRNVQVQQAPIEPSAPAPQSPAPVTPPAPVPTTAPGYTLDDLTKAAIPLMDSGKQPELLQLIQSFGVEALPSLRPEQYGAFATALRGLGAQI